MWERGCVGQRLCVCGGRGAGVAVGGAGWLWLVMVAMGGPRVNFWRSCHPLGLVREVGIKIGCGSKLTRNPPVLECFQGWLISKCEEKK